MRKLVLNIATSIDGYIAKGKMINFVASIAEVLNPSTKQIIVRTETIIKK